MRLIINIGWFLVLFTVFTITTGHTLQIGKRAANVHRHPTLVDDLDRVQFKFEDELFADYWLGKAKAHVTDRINLKKNKNIAKNAVFFLGDGMGIGTITATRVYQGGEEVDLAFDKFPHVALSKTYCIDQQVADSACTATAYLSGVKANYGTIGVNGHVKRYDCDTGLDKANHVKSIAEWALAAGKDVGVVTTTRITHASPSGMYAHIADRDWENNAEVELAGCDSSKVDDIAEQLIYGDIGPKLKVILGGGRREFLNESFVDEEGKPGYRTDGKNLIDEWKQLPGVRNYVWDRNGLLATSVANTENNYLLGLFESDHCKYNLELTDPELKKSEPTFQEMVDVAINYLSKNDKGFVLFAESGRIDLAHHDNFARLAIDDTAEFDRTISATRAKLSEEDTLIIVTADHSHTMTISGYPTRNADILGTSGASTDDNSTYFILNYANGMGYYDHVNETGGRVDPMDIPNHNDMRFVYPALAPIDSETHGGEDVPVYASGPWSHLFTGSFEQNNIPHMLAYALCIGDGLKACE